MWPQVRLRIRGYYCYPAYRQWWRRRWRLRWRRRWAVKLSDPIWIGLGALVCGALLAVALLAATMSGNVSVIFLLVLMAVGSFGLTAMAPKYWWVVALCLALPSIMLATGDLKISAVVLA